MEPTVRIDLDKALRDNKAIEVELGCGAKPRADRITIDRIDLPHVDILADLDNGLPFLPDNSVDAIHSTSVLEHVGALPHLMKEIWRVLKPDGKKHLFVPHFSNPYFYSDYTHERHFGLYSFASVPENFASPPGSAQQRTHRRAALASCGCYFLY